MIKFLFGVSLTMNIIMFFVIVFLIKYRKIVSYFISVKNRFEKTEEILNVEEFKDFMECDKL